MIHFWWPILDETYTIRWINKFSQIIRKKERIAQSNTIRQVFMTFFLEMKDVYLSLFYQFENFNYIELCTYRNNVMWII